MTSSPLPDTAAGYGGLFDIRWMLPVLFLRRYRSVLI